VLYSNSRITDLKTDLKDGMNKRFDHLPDLSSNPSQMHE
jgi:hypothetical protein